MIYTRTISAVKRRSYKYFNKRRGWTTERKIVLIESDDWGSIRMPNKEIYHKTLKFGIRVDNCAFAKNDTLASNDDFNALYDVLRKYKDINGNHPIITANTVMTNPDFNRIREDKFKVYHFELFTETLKKYPNRSFDLWNQGIAEKLFFPQLHGREHLNVTRWLNALQNNSKEIHFAFDNNFYGISSTISNENNPSFMAAFDYENIEGREFSKEATKQAVSIFKDIFGYSSKTFVSPNNLWDEHIEKVLFNKGIMYIQGDVIQHKPYNKEKFHYLGEKNKLNQTYLIRNVLFEPTIRINNDWVSSVLRDIDIAFKQKRPAVICSHRVNFIGSIFEENRTNNLELLNLILGKMLKKHPTIEFMTSAQLCEIIENGNEDKSNGDS